MSIAIVYTTYADEASAKQIGRALVEERLAACYNLLPIQSCFFWAGALTHEDEWVAILKTHPARLAALRTRYLDLHPYETPCCIHWEVEANSAYAAWVEAATLDSP